MATQPVLAALLLPHSFEYEEELEFRGAWVEMADGSVFFDLMQADEKKSFVLRFHGLTATERAAVEDAWSLLLESYESDNFTAPTGATYTVTREPEQPALSWQAQPLANGILRWQADLRLREV